jgi:hypothetical protein
MLTEDKANRVYNFGATPALMERMFVPRDAQKVQLKILFETAMFPQTDDLIPTHSGGISPLRRAGSR